jgi:hypothetical protein
MVYDFREAGCEAALPGPMNGWPAESFDLPDFSPPDWRSRSGAGWFVDAG